MMQSLSVRTLLIATILLIVWPAYAANNITRDVGEIAIIEADTNIIYTATDTNGNPCPQVTVNKKELAKKFYQTHSDDFQFLIMYTNFDYLISPKTDCSNRAAALHNLVSNSITGIGRNTVDNSALYGSSGVLESFLSMSNVNGWQVDPTAHNLVGNNSMLSLLGQEAGHRWLAFVQFDLPGPGITASNALLGRANSHWSFFHHATSATSSGANPEASSAQGNYWEVDQPVAGSFQTTTIVDGFSPLDLYLMGLLPSSQVPSFWYISLPDAVVPAATATSNSRAGTTAQGTQTFVSINDVITAEEARNPTSVDSPKVFRQAFVLLTSQGVDVTQAEIDQVDRYRRAWEAYFGEETQKRGAVLTDLGAVLFVDSANTGAELGTLRFPFNTVTEGRDYIPSGGTVVITAGSYPENLIFNASMTLKSVLGTTHIGQ